MDRNESMPVALITGASRGLGFEFARQYVDDGWRVFAACQDPKSASKLQRLAKDAGGKLAIVAMDVTDSKSVHAAAAQLKDIAIDLVINCAGITGVSGQKVGKVDEPAFAARNLVGKAFDDAQRTHRVDIEHVDPGVVVNLAHFLPRDASDPRAIDD